eukprot:g4771.t1
MTERRYARNARANGGTRPNTIRKWNQKPGDWTSWSGVSHPVNKLYLPPRPKNNSVFNSPFFGGRTHQTKPIIKVDHEGYLENPPPPHIDFDTDPERIATRIKDAVEEVKSFPRRIFLGDWYSQVDPETGKTFYLNRWTGKTSWETPDVMVKAISDAKKEASKGYSRIDAAEEAAQKRKRQMEGKEKQAISDLKRPFTRSYESPEEKEKRLKREEKERNKDPRKGSIPDWRRYTKEGEPWTVPGTDSKYIGTSKRWRASWKKLRPRPLIREGVIKPTTHLNAMMTIARNQDYNKLVETLASGDVVTTINDRCMGGLTALHFACSAAKVGDPVSEEILKILLFFGADVHATTDSNKTALHYACETGHIDLVKRLISAGASINSKTTSNMGKGGETALHMVCERSDTNLARLLIDYGADIDATSDCGLTPLHCAVRQNCAPIVKMLILEGADFDRKDTTGKTPLQVATENEFIDVANHITDLQFRRALTTCTGACNVVTGQQGSCTIYCSCQGYRQSTRRYYCVCGHLLFTHRGRPDTRITNVQKELEKERSSPSFVKKREKEMSQLPELETAKKKRKRKKKEEKRLKKMRMQIKEMKIREEKERVEKEKERREEIEERKEEEKDHLSDLLLMKRGSSRQRRSRNRSRRGSRGSTPQRTGGDNRLNELMVWPPIGGRSRSRRATSSRSQNSSRRGKRPISARTQMMDALLSEIGGGIDEESAAAVVDDEMIELFGEGFANEVGASVKKKKSTPSSRVSSRRSTMTSLTAISNDSSSTATSRAGTAVRRGEEEFTTRRRVVSRRTGALMFQQRAMDTYWSPLADMKHPVTGKKVKDPLSSKGWEGSHWAPGREVDRLGADPFEFQPRSKISRYEHGVVWIDSIKKWEARVRTKTNTMKSLGFFNEAEEEKAARLHDEAAKEIYGEFAILNFGGKDKPSRFPYGVRWNDAKKRWNAIVTLKSGREQLVGMFVEELRAARAYDKASRQIYGANYEKVNL